MLPEAKIHTHRISQMVHRDRLYPKVQITQMRERIVTIQGTYGNEWLLIPTLRISFQSHRYIYISFLKWYWMVILTTGNKAYKPK